jgi:DNA replication protein DnaC
MTAHKTLEAFDFNFQPDLDRAVIEELATLSFIDRNNDLILTGKAGTGKSHILLALALRACRSGHVVKVARCVDLLSELYAGFADGSFERRLQTWARADFVVIDDVGLGQLPRANDEPTAAHLLYNLIDLRHNKRSTAITSNIRLSEWGRYLGDVTVTAAILDRLAMTSTRIEINGPSFRQHVARQRSTDAETEAETKTKTETKTKKPTAKSKRSKS